MSKHWDQHQSWESAEAAWDKKAQTASEHHPLKVLKQLPNMPGITSDTAPFLRLKALKYMLKEDHTGIFPRYLLKHPIKYSWRLIKSYLRKKSYLRDNDFFLYGIKNFVEFQKLQGDPKSLLIVGFSYCHKPFECPSGRFTPNCQHALDNPVCQQCFIGKAMHALPAEKTIPVVIPTIHYIGEKIFEIQKQHPGRKIIFLITACELTLEMFGDLGHMAGVKGIGVRLDGRICNTFKAFELSEKGIKPGLTVVTPETQRQLLDLIRLFR